METREQMDALAPQPRHALPQSERAPSGRGAPARVMGAPSRAAPRAAPEVLEAVRSILLGHRGEENAITLELLTAVVRETFFPERPARRRVEEAVQALALTWRDEAVCSGPNGIFLAETIEELNRSIVSLTRHALPTLKRRSALKRHRARLMGQIARAA